MALDPKGKDIKTFQGYCAEQRAEGELNKHPWTYVDRFKTTWVRFLLAVVNSRR